MHIAEIKSCIGKFFWSGFIFKTNREQLYLDYDQGGLRLVDPELKTRALFIKNALDWGIPNSSEEYIIKNLKTQNLPLAFKELIVETKKIKEMSDISTTASIYRYYISQKNIIPSVRFDYPTIQWGIVWKNLNYNFICSEDKSTCFAFWNNIISNKEKLVAYNIGRIDNSVCDQCSLSDSNQHRLELCASAQIISNWTKTIILKQYKIKLSNLEDILHYEIDDSKENEKAALWLAVRTISFNLKRYPLPSLYVFKKEIREMRWENRSFFNHCFGSYLNIC